MKRIKSGEGGIVDLGTSSEDNLAPTTVPQPEDYIRPPVTEEESIADARQEYLEYADEVAGRFRIETPDVLKCPNCGTNLKVEAKVYGRVTGE